MTSDTQKFASVDIVELNVRFIISLEVNANNAMANLQDFKQGFYVLNISYHKTIISRKFIEEYRFFHSFSIRVKNLSSKTGRFYYAVYFLQASI
jgi:hypothetical protein